MIEVRLEFGKTTYYFGRYNPEDEIVGINLPAFNKGEHLNDGFRAKFQRKPTDDELVQGICYTIEHEVLHYVHNEIEGEEYNDTAEWAVYHAIGNGGNGFFNVFYDMAHNPKWIKGVLGLKS